MTDGGRKINKDELEYIIGTPSDYEKIMRKQTKATTTEDLISIKIERDNIGKLSEILAIVGEDDSKIGTVSHEDVIKYSRFWLNNRVL